MLKIMYSSFIFLGVIMVEMEFRNTVEQMLLTNDSLYYYLSNKYESVDESTIPNNYKDMLELAKKLAKDFLFVRVDFYNVNNTIYFGELTFFHFSGNVPFEPEEWDYKIGEWLKLPKIF